MFGGSWLCSEADLRETTALFDQTRHRITVRCYENCTCSKGPP
jgi:hypothetical protein